MSVETERSSTESDASGLDYEETALTLGLPGGGRGGGAELERARVVGWPPVRNYRRNEVLKMRSNKNKLVKVAVDGAPYLRKVDLEAYSGYQQLLSALQDMFSCFTIRNYPNEERKLVDPIHGTEYVPTYEDKDGDWMLVGDVPWKIFVDACKRLRLMKSSEAINLAPRASQG